MSWDLHYDFWAFVLCVNNRYFALDIQKCGYPTVNDYAEISIPEWFQPRNAYIKATPRQNQKNNLRKLHEEPVYMGEGEAYFWWAFNRPQVQHRDAGTR